MGMIPFFYNNFAVSYSGVYPMKETYCYINNPTLVLILFYLTLGLVILYNLYNAILVIIYSRGNNKNSD